MQEIVINSETHRSTAGKCTDENFVALSGSGISLESPTPTSRFRDLWGKGMELSEAEVEIDSKEIMPSRHNNTDVHMISRYCDNMHKTYMGSNQVGFPALRMGNGYNMPPNTEAICNL